MINRAVPVKQVQVVFIHSDETISKCLYNIFLVVQRIRRATLAGFGENNVIVKAPPRVYEKYSTRVCVERLIQHEAKPSAVFASRYSPSAVFFICTSIGSALTVIFYCISWSYGSE